MISKILYFIFGIVSALLFLSAKQPMLLLFSLFLITLSFQNILQKINNKINIPFIIKIIIYMVLIGLITEFLAIWNNINLTPDQITETNQLFSSDPLTDIILGLGYYIPLATIWFFLLKKYDYQIKDAFIIMGIFGIFFEGGGLILISLNPIMWVYAFIIHGSYVGILSIITKNDTKLMGQIPTSKLKKYIVGFLSSILIVIPYALWMGLIKSIN